MMLVSMLMGGVRRGGGQIKPLDLCLCGPVE